MTDFNAKFSGASPPGPPPGTDWTAGPSLDPLSCYDKVLRKTSEMR